MKKYLIKIVFLFLIIIVIDIVSGKVFGYMLEHAKGGDNGRNNFIMNQVNDEILVFGSSRAVHHYHPTIISDSLGMSCYNCGQDGMGVIVSYARYQTICKRYHPKMVIYDIMPGFDLLKDDNHKYLKWLRAYYDYDGIANVFETIDNTEKYKMISQMYRYNTNFGQLVIENIQPVQPPNIKGFKPKDEVMDTMKVSKKNIVAAKEAPVYDSLKISYLRKMVEESKDTRIIFAMSPCWAGNDTTVLRPIKQICAEYNIPFVDFSNAPKFVHNNDYFSDGGHLNVKGAEEFTKDFMQQLKTEGLLE